MSLPTIYCLLFAHYDGVYLPNSSAEIAKIVTESKFGLLAEELEQRSIKQFLSWASDYDSTVLEAAKKVVEQLDWKKDFAVCLDLDDLENLDTCDNKTLNIRFNQENLKVEVFINQADNVNLWMGMSWQITKHSVDN